MADFDIVKALVAEFVGTAFLMTCGCWGYTSEVCKSVPMASMTMMIIFTFRPISGGHANTSVTLSCFLMNYMNMMVAALYMIAQFSGALFGYYLLTLVLPSKTVYDCSPPLCLTIPNENLEWYQVFGVEFICTFILLLVWQVFWDKISAAYVSSLPFVMGLVVFICSECAQSYTGGSLNLARSLAPAIVHNKFDQIHVYVAAHITASVVSCIFWKIVEGAT